MNRRSPEVLAVRVVTPDRSNAAAYRFAGRLRRSRVVTALAIITAASIFSVDVRAAEIPSAIRTDPAPSAELVHSYVEKSIKDLQSDDAKAATSARVDLINNVGGLLPVSSEFLNVYAIEVTTQLTAVLKLPSTKDNPRLRLNLAIITAKVAEKTLDARFAPLVAIELKDSNEGVVIWGLKGARFVIPSAMDVGALGKSLIPATIGAAKQWNKSGEVISAAYDALTPEPTTVPPTVTLIVPVQDLLAWRIKQYETGIPVEPYADATATAYLTNKAVWNAQKPADQNRTLQLILNLISAESSNLPNVPPVDHDLHVKMLQYAGKALVVYGYDVGDQSFADAMNTGLAAARPSMNADDIAALSKAAITATLTKVPALIAPKSAPALAPTPSAPPKVAP